MLFVVVKENLPCLIFVPDLVLKAINERRKRAHKRPLTLPAVKKIQKAVAALERVLVGELGFDDHKTVVVVNGVPI